MTLPARDLELIKLGLKEWGHPTITGANLGDLIRENAPDVDVREVVGMPSGTGALRRFVTEHLDEVLHYSGNKQGSDPIYTINLGESEQPKSTSVDDDDAAKLWTTFARTYAPKVILLTNSGAIKVVDAPASQNDGEQQIKSATRDELDAIRAQFTETLTQKLADSDVVIPDAHAPFDLWSLAVKKLGLGHYRDWAIYRVDKIVGLFESRLRAFNVDEARVIVLARHLRSAQMAARTKAKTRVKAKTMDEATSSEAASGSSLPTNSPPDSDGAFRTAVAHAIAALPISDLRELRLPAGVLWDIINQQPRNI
ncbi:hypothetical protein [Pandoraea pnomenusa]|uniref:hypothetical protein n=1 Tax=Pandoraea pnomenusa TaxID=93220 RepID=UPI00334087C4